MNNYKAVSILGFFF